MIGSLVIKITFNNRLIYDWKGKEEEWYILEEVVFQCSDTKLLFKVLSFWFKLYFDLKFFPFDSQLLLIKIRVSRVDQHRITNGQLAPASERYELSDIGSVRLIWRFTKTIQDSVHLLSPEDTNT